MARTALAIPELLRRLPEATDRGEARREAPSLHPPSRRRLRRNDG